MEICRGVISAAGMPIVALDIGGGFPAPYPGMIVPPLARYFERIKAGLKNLNLPKDTHFMCEPGRGISAFAFSVITQIIARRPDQVYMNDGIYGSFSEMSLPKSDISYPARTFRTEGAGMRALSGAAQAFTVYGPTCDTLDVLPLKVGLPADIQTGDYVEFGLIGAYSYSNRTDFNGFRSDEIAIIDGPDARPPGFPTDM